jgi:hypothetical protein
MSQENVDNLRRGFEAYVTPMSSTNKLARTRGFADEMRFGPHGNVGKLNGTRWR